MRSYAQAGPSTRASEVGDFIENLLNSARRELRHRREPITILLGPRGAGKTYLLEGLATAYAGQTPSAILNLENAAEHETLGLLVELASGLHRKSRHAFRVKFPLLTLSLFAASVKTRSDDELDHRNQFKSAFRNWMQLRSPLAREDQVAALTGLLVQARILPQRSDDAARTLVRALGAATGMRLRSLWHRWLQQAYPAVAAGNSIDAMVTLSKRWNNPEIQDKPLVGELMFQAFLEDLYRSFSGPLDSFDRRTKYLALLDNADSPGGLLFLQRLAEAKAMRDRLMTPAAPLVVVAGMEAIDPMVPEDARGVDQLSYLDWMRRHGEGGFGTRSWWYPVALRELSVSECTTLLTEHTMLHQRRHPGEQRLPEILHWLSHGHPYALHVLTERLAERLAERSRPDPIGDLWSTTPDGRGSGGGVPTPADDVLERWWGAADEDLRKKLTRGVATDLSTIPALFDDAADLAEAIRTRLWDVEIHPGLHEYLAPLVPEVRTLAVDYIRGRLGTYPVLHPLLRRLAQHRLANGEDDDYRRVHEELMAHHRSEGETIQYAHHRLALGELAEVADHLADRFEVLRDSDHLKDWLMELYLITAAPNREDWPKSSSDTFRGLVAETGGSLTNILRGLAGALWILSDPLRRTTRLEPDREFLHSQIAEFYSVDLPPLVSRPTDRLLLRAMAERYRSNPLPWRLSESAGRRP